MTRRDEEMPLYAMGLAISFCVTLAYMLDHGPHWHAFAKADQAYEEANPELFDEITAKWHDRP